MKTSVPSTRFRRPRIAPLVVLWLSVGAVMLFGSLAAPVLAQSQDVRFAAGLRERRLFDLAESMGEQRLQSSTLAPLERANLLIELLRAYADHALNSAPENRQALWAKASQQSAEFLRLHKTNPRLFLVQLQAALGALAQGRLARQEAEVGARVEEAMAAARAQTRNAIRKFETLLNDLEREIPMRRRAQLRAGDLTPDELFTLQNNVLLQLGHAYENQALCYPPGSDDQVAALTVALEHLAEPIKQLPAGDPLILEIRLQQATCLRLRGDFAQSERLLASLLNDKTSLAIRQQGAAELARIRLQQGKSQEAKTILGQAGSGHPELEFARLETLATIIKAAGDSTANPTTDAVRKEAVSLVAKIEDQHGPYWGRRSSQLLVRIAGDAGGGAGLEILRRTAETLYLKGDLPRALAAYEKASDRALSMDNLEAAFNYRLTAALIEKKREQLPEYLRRLRETAIKVARYEKASDAHLSAISACIGLARNDRSQIKLYEELLLEHLENWPGNDSADQVRMWLGKMRAAQGNWVDAIAAFGTVKASSDHYGAAVRNVAPCWQSHLQAVQKRGGPMAAPAALGDLANRAAQYFESILLDDNGAFPQTWSALDEIAALNAARIRIRYRPDDLAKAERLLKAALQASPDAEAEWTRNARAWLVVALGGQGRANEAAQWISTLAGADPNDLFQMVRQIHQFGEHANGATARTLQSVEQDALRILQPVASKLSPPDQLSLQIIQGEAFVRRGQVREAQELLQQLAKMHGKNGAVQEAYAKSLSAARSSLKQALNQWRIVAAGSQKESPRWYRAKYHVAQAYYELGQKKDAADRIRYLQLTSKMNTPLKLDFNLLLKKCQ